MITTRTDGLGHGNLREDGVAHAAITERVRMRNSLQVPQDDDADNVGGDGKEEQERCDVAAEVKLAVDLERQVNSNGLRDIKNMTEGNITRETHD